MLKIMKKIINKLIIKIEDRIEDHYWRPNIIPYLRECLTEVFWAQTFPSDMKSQIIFTLGKNLDQT